MHSLKVVIKTHIVWFKTKRWRLGLRSGLTHYEINEQGEFLLAGFNYEGQLAAALEISTQPFKA